jgi:hypothetical protein
MTRGDAKVIAEELYKLMQKNGQIKDTYYTKEEASEIYKVPVSHFEHYGHLYPRKKFGRSWKYSGNGLERFLRS